MILRFGRYKGFDISNIPDDSYLQFLAKPKYSGKFYASIHSTELKWKVPFAVKNEARQILEKRGYQLKGETWEKL